MNNDYPSSKKEFDALITQWRTWYRVRLGLSGIAKGAVFGSALALGLSLVLILSGYGLKIGLGRQTMILLMLIVSFGSGVLLGIVSFIWPVSNLRLLRLYDRTFQLKDRASTAYEFALNTVEHHPGSILERQLLDTLSIGKQVKPAAAFFWSVPKSLLVSLFSIILLSSVLILMGRPYFQQVAYRQGVKEAIETEVLALESLKSAVEENESLSEEDQAELAQEIEETIRKLEQANSIEEAVAALANAESTLQSVDDENLRDQVLDLRQLGNQITQSEESTALEEFGQALSEGNLIEAAQALDDLNIEDISAEEREALSNQLSDAASSLSDTNPDLADQLSQAAGAVQNGDSQSAREALSGAAQDLVQTAGQTARANAVQEITGQTGQSTDRLIEAGRNASSSQTGTVEVQPGSGQQDGSGSGTGQAQSDAQGSPTGAGSSEEGQGSGGGAGSGSSDQGDLQGSGAGSDPIDQGNDPGDGGERPFVPMTDPKPLSDAAGSEVYLPESQSTNGEVTGLMDSSIGNDNASTVPYTEVFAEFSEVYRQSIENGSIPPGMRDLVRDYFSGLEP